MDNSTYEAGIRQGHIDETKSRLIRAYELFALSCGGLSELSLTSPASLEAENALSALVDFKTMAANFCVTWSGHDPQLNYLLGALDLWEECMNAAGYFCCQVATLSMHKETTLLVKAQMAREVWARAYFEHYFAFVMDGVGTDGHLDIEEELLARRLLTGDDFDALRQTSLRYL